GELPLDEIGSGPRMAIANRGLPSLAATDAFQARRSHQAGDALAADVGPLGPQFGMDPRCPIGSSRSLVDGSDPFRQRLIFLRPRRKGTISPPVVPAGGDIQHAAHGGDRMHGPVLLHEAEDFGGTVSLANQAAAFFK